MKIFSFELMVSKLNARIINDLAELQGGRPDCCCFSTSRKHFIGFDRKARSLGEAIDSAMEECRKVGTKVLLVHSCVGKIPQDEETRKVLRARYPL